MRNYHETANLMQTTVFVENDFSLSFHVLSPAVYVRSAVSPSLHRTQWKRVL